MSCSFAKVLRKPGKMAFGNQSVLVWEHFVNWTRSVYIYIYVKKYVLSEAKDPFLPYIWQCHYYSPFWPTQTEGIAIYWTESNKLEQNIMHLISKTFKIFVIWQRRTWVAPLRVPVTPALRRVTCAWSYVGAAATDSRHYVLFHHADRVSRGAGLRLRPMLDILDFIKIICRSRLWYS